eukprot:PhF_6_TR14942/c0_g1_i3/m.23429
MAIGKHIIRAACAAWKRCGKPWPGGEEGEVYYDTLWYNLPVLSMFVEEICRFALKKCVEPRSEVQPPKWIESKLKAFANAIRITDPECQTPPEGHFIPDPHLHLHARVRVTFFGGAILNELVSHLAEDHPEWNPEDLKSE